ncbi:MAG: Clp protease N-terminal domain-containing protein [Planctomycetota bacterium]|jgi:ATP-dependent Clp protease ATP-binding subunit ClpA
MLEVFSANAREAMALARMEAHYFSDERIRPEYLLIAILEVRQSSGGGWLKARGLSAEVARYTLRRMSGKQVGRETGRDIPYAKIVKRVLEIAIDYAVQAGENFIGTSHILMGILEGGEEPSRPLLEAMKVDPDALARELSDSLRPPGGAPEPAKGGGEEPSILGKLVYNSFKEVERRDDDELRPEHLLLAILKFDQERFSKILAACGLTQERVMAAIETADRETGG